MRTAHSINLKEVSDRCFAGKIAGACSIRTSKHYGCGTYECPMYKPEGCRDWIRVEEGDDITLIPPEEYKCARQGQKKTRIQLLEDYTCSFCGVTLEDCHQWGPICRKTGKRVCATCCYKCEHHKKWSGIWQCGYITPEQKREEVLRRIRNREEAEIARATEAYRRKRQEQARQRAARSARAKAGQGSKK